MSNYKDQSYSLYPKTGGSRSMVSNEHITPRGKISRDVSGYVETPQGFVRACSSYYQGGHRHSFLEIIKDGRVHYRRFDKDYTARGLVTKAKQFAKDLHQ